MTKTVLFIDGENFIHKLEDALIKNGIHKSKIELGSYDFHKLFTNLLKKYHVSRKIYYAAKLHNYPDTRKKSEELIKLQRKLRNNLINQKFEFVIAGNVRGQKVDNKTIFREKGVDVKIAVDLVAMACDKKISMAVVCSSDSDLQPAIAELRKRKIKVIYVGFETSPNKGLIYTTNKTILLRNPEIIKACRKE